jgi:hypothetical protein
MAVRTLWSVAPISNVSGDERSSVANATWLQSLSPLSSSPLMISGIV